MTKGKDSIRTPLGHARGLGSAKEGSHHWWMQRVSAVALIPLSIYILSSMPFIAETDHATFVSWLASPGVAITAILFVLTSFYHAALGIQIIVEDYVTAEGWKLALLMLNNFAFIAMGAVCLFSIIYIGLSFHGH
jgi:succinate dehydrogenase / fumarate reductase membrane anchor subunit